jgi:hypothetical protein
MLWVILYPTLSGCVTFFSLDPYLDKAVGKQANDIEYPQLKYHKLMSDDGSRVVMQYSLTALWHCRWIFEFQKKDNVIASWRYPDAEAAAWCRKLPTSMP